MSRPMRMYVVTRSSYAIRSENLMGTVGVIRGGCLTVDYYKCWPTHREALAYINSMVSEHSLMERKDYKVVTLEAV